MAEGGSLATIRDSDAIFEYSCTPCADDGSNHEAVKYCLECKEYLCGACSKYHLKFSATKTHRLLGKDSFKHGSVQMSTATKPKKTKCPVHKGRDIEMYCGSHDMVYCALCVAKEHRSCSDVFEVDEAANRYFAPSDEITVAKFEKVAEDLAQLKKKRTDDIKTLEKEKNEELAKVQHTKEKLIKHIQKLAEETTTKINTVHTNLKQEIENVLHDIDNTTETIEYCRQDMIISEELDTSEQFVQQKVHKSILSAAESLLDETFQLKSKKIICQQNDVLVNIVINATFLVKVEDNNNQKKSVLKQPPSFKSMITVNVKESSDIIDCTIISICQLLDGTIILADCYNSKLKRLDDQYRVNDHCDLEAGPRGICCTATNEVAVKLRNDKVQFVSVGKQMLKTRQFDIKGGVYYGFVSFADTLWSYTGSGVNIYSKSGILLNSLKNDSFGKQLVKSTSLTCIFPVASTKTFVYVSDLASSTACLNDSENVSMMLADSKLKQIMSACISSNGIMFVAGFLSHNIMMFGSDGKCLGELVAPDQGIKYPQALCYDSEKHKVIVGCFSNNDIVVIDLDM